MTRKIIPFLFLLALCSCAAKQISVPPIDTAEPAGTMQVPGKYAILVQSGQWNAKESTRDAPLGAFGALGHGCAPYHFKFDVDSAFQDAAKKSLTSVLASIDFIEAPLTSEQVFERGYEAQIVVREGSLRINHDVFGFVINAKAYVDICLEFIDRKGDYRTIAPATGASTRNFYATCDTVGDVAVEAVQDGLRKAAHSSALAIRNRLKPANP